MEELVFKTQDLLVKLGYDPGPLDGAMGGKTRLAIEAYLTESGVFLDDNLLDAQGNPTMPLWDELLRASLRASGLD